MVSSLLGKVVGKIFEAA